MIQEEWKFQRLPVEVSMQLSKTSNRSFNGTFQNFCIKKEKKMLSWFFSFYLFTFYFFSLSRNELLVCHLEMFFCVCSFIDKILLWWYSARGPGDIGNNPKLGNFSKLLNVLRKNWRSSQMISPAGDQRGWGGVIWKCY